MAVTVATVIVEDTPDALAEAVGGLYDLGVAWEQIHRVPSVTGVQHWQIAVVDADSEPDAVLAHAADSSFRSDHQPLPDHDVTATRRIEQEKSAGSDSSLINDGERVEPRLTRSGFGLLDELVTLPGVVGLQNASSLTARSNPFEALANAAKGRLSDGSQSQLMPNGDFTVYSESMARVGVNTIIPQLVERFPAVSRILATVDRQYRLATDRSGLYRELGERTGRCLAVGHPRIHQMDTIHDTLEYVITGMLFPIARGLVRGNDWCVIDSTFLDTHAGGISAIKQRLLRGQQDRAEFVAGLLAGLLNHAEKLPNINVDYHSKRHNGVTQWTFQVEAT